MDSTRPLRLTGVVDRFGPPLVLMGVIFYLSSRPNLSSGLGDLDLVLRKGAHMTEYALLTLLWWRGLRTRSPWPAWAVAVLYAITDELHQTTVTGRHGAPIDVLIDAFGGLLGIAAWRLTASRARSR